jgi:hypothetical protein
VPQNHNPPRIKLTPATLARLAEIKNLELKMENLSDEELRRRTAETRDRLLIGKAAVNQS